MYVDGHVDIFHMIDIDLFSVIALNMMVVQLGYTCKFDHLFYNYLRPLTTLDEGLYALACEEDVRCLATLVRSFKLIEVYIEHGVTAVNSYQRPPPHVRATIEDITELGSSATVIKDVMGQLSFEKTELDGKAGFDDVARSGIDSFGLSHDESFGVDDLNLNLNVIMDLNVSQTETQDELHVSKVLVSEEADVSRTEVLISEEADGNGQEAVEAPKPEVDVHVFGISMDVPFDNIGVTNLVPYDVLKGEDVDVIDLDC
ncbi:hypothetical protein Tco_1399520 [Tanacetum coccineum]